MSKLLDQLVAESKTELGKDAADKVDWAAVDAGVFARIARERREERARFGALHGGRWTLGVGVAAGALTVALFAGRTRDLSEPDVGAVENPSAGAIVAIDARSLEGGASVTSAGGDARVLVGGAPAVAGTRVLLGDVIETHGAQAVLERAGKVTMIVEPGSRAVVTHVRGALVVALERGAVEAQVTPVAAGEAFAVDVDRSRVAVHGTHLRVARDGDRAVVDLTEGVVSVGDAPREGEVLGTIVNAPAHVEFAARDAVRTLTETHDPAAVRAAQPRSQALVAPPVLSPRLDAAPPSRPDPREPHAAQPPHSGPAPAPAAAPPAAPIARDSIADAVRACMASRPRADDNVTVVVQTALHLEIGDDGSVRSARFDPPVAPDVNTCAAPAIYRAKFVRADGATVVVPVDFKN